MALSRGKRYPDASYPEGESEPPLREDVRVMFDGYHLRVERLGSAPPLTWDELQVIKNEFAGEETTAVEVYPPQHEVVNQMPMRHLWIVPADKVPSLMPGRRRIY